MSQLEIDPEVIAFDSETHPIGIANLAPKIVCMAVGMKAQSRIESTFDRNALSSVIDIILNKDDCLPNARFVACNAKYDLAVIAANFPGSLPLIFKGLQEGRFEDIIIREKLLHLSSHGDLEFFQIASPDPNNLVPVNIKLEYGLAALSKRYLGKSRKDDKEANDSWRLFYNQLEGIAVPEWPNDARQYVMDDVQDCLAIRELQESERFKVGEFIGADPFKTQDFRVACDFALYLMSMWGFEVDPVEKAKIEADLAAALTPEKMARLVEAKILIPGKPSSPYANGAKNPDGTPKMKAAVKDKISKTTLCGYVEKFCAAKGIPLKKTEATEKNPDGVVSTTIDFFEEHWTTDPIFEEYYNRQKLQKLVTTELPRMNWNGVTSPIVHPCFDVLKRTGRTSSFASDLYPSFNCQNVDPRVRECLKARDGWLMFSIDYSGMELGTLAQKTFSLFGHSVLRDKINAGIDPHAYLGSQLAYHLDIKFRESCDQAGANEPAKIYEAFSACKKHAEKPVQDFFKHYRTFAKPTGLGYPGGLGAKTFCSYAKATYGLEVDEQMAQELRKIWLMTYPEMTQYFRWINDSCHDLVDPDKFAYMTPLGMYRAGADYCAAANGAALQSPSAEGALLAVFNVIRACFDSTLGSILLDDDKGPTTRPIAFVHDEIIGEVRDDEKAHDRVHEIAQIMVDAFKVVTPDVVVKAQPVLMRRWNKAAEPAYKDGKLIPWTPKAK